jgi:hypothetical protein
MTWATSWVGALEHRNCQGRDLLNCGKRQKKGKVQKQQQISSTAAAKCAAFVEMTIWVSGFGCPDSGVRTLINKNAMGNYS